MNGSEASSSARRPDGAVADAVPRLLELVRDPTVLQRLDEPIELASGEMSRDFIDGKRAVVDPDALGFVGQTMAAAAAGAGVEFDAVGGLVLGAVPFTFAVARTAGCPWFLVRQKPKGRGTNQWVEGATLSAGTRVMLVEDVVTTGGSIVTACERVHAEGGEVVFATALVDRGDRASAWFERAGIPYRPLLTYHDLGIDPVGGGPQAPTAP